MITNIAERQTVNIEDLIGDSLENFNIIDVRSPIEFRSDHISTAVNIPILDDGERKITGMIYRKAGPSKAKYKALELIAPKIPEIIERIKLFADNGKPIIIYCARGGDRSLVVHTLLDLIQIKSKRLFSGYKGYRKYILDFFSKSTFPQCITLYGPTGCGKTKILKMLAEKGFPILNLEEYAAHKGSSFGGVGETKFATINQKIFESHIWYHFYKMGFIPNTIKSTISWGANYVFVEGESKKIGKVVIPERLFYSLNTGIKVYLEMPLEERVKYIIDVYKPQDYKKELIISLERIDRYVGKVKTKILKDLLCEENYIEFCFIILKEYYDPLYKHSMPEFFDYKIYYKDFVDAEVKLEEIFYKQFS